MKAGGEARGDQVTWRESPFSCIVQRREGGPVYTIIHQACHSRRLQGAAPSQPGKTGRSSRGVRSRESWCGGAQGHPKSVGVLVREKMGELSVGRARQLLGGAQRALFPFLRSSLLYVYPENAPRATVQPKREPMLPKLQRQGAPGGRNGTGSRMANFGFLYRLAGASRLPLAAAERALLRVIPRSATEAENKDWGIAAERLLGLRPGWEWRQRSPGKGSLSVERALCATRKAGVISSVGGSNSQEGSNTATEYV